MKKLLSILILIISFANLTEAQHLGFGAKGGLLVGTQKGKRALVSYHADLFFETMGKWQGENLQRRLGFVAQVGYHRRGASYSSGIFGSNPTYIANDLFHNISVAALLKGNFKFNEILPYYAAGVRLDITAKSEVVNGLDAQGVRPVNFGFWLGAGVEWEPIKLPFGMFIEINVSPDVTPQVFFPKGTVVYYRDYYSNQEVPRAFNEDYKIINISIELTLGIKFLARKNTELVD